MLYGLSLHLFLALFLQEEQLTLREAQRRVKACFSREDYSCGGGLSSQGGFVLGSNLESPGAAMSD